MKKKPNRNGLEKYILDDPKVRRELARKSHYWFFHIYLTSYIKYKTAAFQKEMFSLTQTTDIKTAVIVAFRGSAKSTIMSLSYPIWAMITGKKKGDSVQFDVLKSAQLKLLLDHYRGDFIDIGLAINSELLYALAIFKIKVPDYSGDAFMKTRDLWSKELKKRTSLKNSTKKTRRNAFKSIHIRNKYAHGKLSFQNNEPFLTFDNEDGVEVTEIFTEQVINEDKQHMESTLDELRKLNFKLSKCAS